MAENINYNVSGSKCYGDDPANCAKYGRLYDWATAMALDVSCNSSYCNSQISAKHQGVCPSGWHIPSSADWNALMAFILTDKELGSFTSGSSNYAGKYLKTTSGWNSSGNGLDSYGFSALPGGYGDSGGYFSYVGNLGSWWSASEGNSYNAYGRYMGYNYENAYWLNYNKYGLQSIRCLQD
jgi:uncharacterized protein (TIGR02145 family)